MKRRWLALISITLCMSMFLSSCSSETSRSKHKVKSDDDEYTEIDVSSDVTIETSERDIDVRPVASPTPTPEPVIYLTEQDIKDMNGGNALIVKGDNGYVTTIYGKYFHRPVTDHEDAINALRGIASLIGIEEGYFPYAVYGASHNGYTYYTYQQLYGDVSVYNATLKMVIDPEGYPVMLQSSLVANLGYKISSPSITASEAEQIVIDTMGSKYSVLSNYTVQTSLNDDFFATHAYQVFTNNPYGDISFDMPYIMHFVDYDGNYLISYPTDSLPNGVNDDFLGNESYFTNMTATDYTFIITRNNQNYEFTVPVSYNSVDGKYYLCDPSRKIIMADFYEFIFNDGNLVFECKEAPETWNTNHLITYYNYIQAYDYYLSLGIQSTDGFGMPMLILTNWVDQNKNAVNNACNMGVINGWSCFGSSEANTYGFSLDVVAHEFTHGVTGYSRQGILYYNETGAINEAFSDIMGNLCEMSMGETTDTNWLLGETSNNICRSMSNPYDYRQPMYVGDLYYFPTSSAPGSANDNGGVHLNNSLVSHLCYVLYQQGMSLDDLAIFFLKAIEMHTPKADYDDMYAVFVAAAEMCGYDDIVPLISQYWKDACLAGDRNVTAQLTAVDGYERINVRCEDGINANNCVLVVEGYGFSYVTNSTAMLDGCMTTLIPADGNLYVIYIMEFSDQSYSNCVNVKYLSTDCSYWTTNMYEGGLFVMASGRISDVVNYS